MSINEIKDFIFENYYKWIGLSKGSYYLMKHLKKKKLFLLRNKLIENIPDPHNGKQQYQPFILMKNRKSVQQLKIISYQPRTFQNPEIVDKK